MAEICISFLYSIKILIQTKSLVLYPFVQIVSYRTKKRRKKRTHTSFYIHHFWWFEKIHLFSHTVSKYSDPSVWVHQLSIPLLKSGVQNWKQHRRCHLASIDFVELILLCLPKLPLLMKPKVALAVRKALQCCAWNQPKSLSLFLHLFINKYAGTFHTGI